MKCEACDNTEIISAMVRGKYHASICRSCLAELSSVSLSGGAQSHARRRDWEDNAQDTVQPYDAGGNPRPEFYRLYPRAAEKTFTKEEIERVKRQL